MLSLPLWSVRLRLVGLSGHIISVKHFAKNFMFLPVEEADKRYKAGGVRINVNTLDCLHFCAVHAHAEQLQHRPCGI